MTKRVLGIAILLVGLAAIGQAAIPDQPFMQAARADLMKAKAELQLAMRDKGGHRAKALSLVNRAIAEVDKGIAFDRRHNHALRADQPHMDRAKGALESAKDNLDRATADKGGHRAKALDLVRDAIDEVKKGIEAGRS
jgi:hypothetical protein